MFYQSCLSNILIDAKQACKAFGDSQTTFYRNAKEIEEQIEKGRYNRYAVVKDSRTRVNILVYYDYSRYREQLLNPLAKVPKFNERMIADMVPAIVIREATE